MPTDSRKKEGCGVRGSQGWMFGNAEKTAFGVSQGRPLHVGILVKDIPLMYSAQSYDAFHFRSSSSPRHSQVKMANLPVRTRIAERLEHHWNTATLSARQIGHSCIEVRRNTHHSAPEFSQLFGVGGFYIPRPKCDLW